MTATEPVGWTWDSLAEFSQKEHKLSSALLKVLSFHNGGIHKFVSAPKSLYTDRTPPHVPVSDAMTATEPVGWTWDSLAEFSQKEHKLSSALLKVLSFHNGGIHKFVSAPKSLYTDRTPAHVPVSDAMTATEPVRWTWDSLGEFSQKEHKLSSALLNVLSFHNGGIHKFVSVPKSLYTDSGFKSLEN
ncbi:hypothetical protein AVEN_28216-1 [Araneus ventricosus]|uniref:Uncharacterized protein n=1 Tax=Araneus ventricosus TaxID=182803 RepID=A0A4Y2EVH5_ARAVE|nr:hypothetical protein AVEN_28216-1 [Araneus ventricosus]